MAHFDSGTDLLIILLAIAGVYLVLAATLLIQDMLGRKDSRKMASCSRFRQSGAPCPRRPLGHDLLSAPSARQSLPGGSPPIR